MIDSNASQRRQFLRVMGTSLVAATAGCLRDHPDLDVPGISGSSGTEVKPQSTVTPRLPLGLQKPPVLVADDGDFGDGFGTSVALDGDLAVIGAPKVDSDHGEDSGAAYLFARSQDGWIQETKLTQENGARGNRFGSSVAIHRDTVLVGAPGDEKGSVAVFDRSETGWSQTTTLDPRASANANGFGIDLAFQGDLALIGAPGTDDNAGAMYYFIRSEPTIWDQHQPLVPDDSDPFDFFGTAVALDWPTAVIGASGDEDPNGVGSGSAYVYTKTPNGWDFQKKLLPVDGDSDDAFGGAVAIEDGTIIIGASGDEDPMGDPDEEFVDYSAGSAYVFANVNNRWIQQAKLWAEDGRPGRDFGTAVALSGDVALVGDDFVEPSGGTYVFVRSGGWRQERVLKPDPERVGNGFGQSVDVNGSIAIVGDSGADPMEGQENGAAFIFDV